MTKIIKRNWSNKMLVPEMFNNANIHWVDDNDNNIKYKAKFQVNRIYPQYAGVALFGIFGGNVFEPEESNTEKIETYESVRGLDFPAWCIFDKNGEGIIFC